MDYYKIYYHSRSHKNTLTKIINNALDNNKIVEIYPQDKEAFLKAGEAIATINKECKIQKEGHATKYVLIP